MIPSNGIVSVIPNAIIVDVELVGARAVRSSTRAGAWFMAMLMEGPDVPEGDDIAIWRVGSIRDRSMIDPVLSIDPTAHRVSRRNLTLLEEMPEDELIARHHPDPTEADLADAAEAEACLNRALDR